MKPTALALMIIGPLLLSACAPAAQLSTSTPSTPASTAVLPSPTVAPTEIALPTDTPVLETELQARGYHSAAYDIQSDRVIVYGGQYDTRHLLADTWAYDVTANTWTEMSPLQSPGLTEGPMAYDSESNRIILFAGNLFLSASQEDVPGMPLGIDRDSKTWAYDFDTNTWTNLRTAEGPSGLLGARMVYDTQSDRMILFGGLNVPLDFESGEIYHNDTWAYDYNTNKWTNTHSETCPPGRNYFAMAYDGDSDRVILWGSSEDPNDNDLWTYDFETNTWAARPVEEPTNLEYAAMAYVPTMQRALLFGGLAFSGTLPRDKLWAYSSSSDTWEEIDPGSSPSPRGWHTLTYATNPDRLVLIGGGKDVDHNTNEVWLFDPLLETWQQVWP